MDTVLEGRICKREGERFVPMSGTECYAELKRIVWYASKKNGIQLTDDECHDVATTLWERAGEFRPGKGSHLGGWLTMLARGYTRNKIRKTTLQAKTHAAAEDFDCPQGECHDEKSEENRKTLVKIAELAINNGEITVDEFRQVLAYYGHGITLDSEVKRTTGLMRLRSILERLRMTAQQFCVS